MDLSFFSFFFYVTPRKCCLTWQPCTHLVLLPAGPQLPANATHLWHYMSSDSRSHEDVQVLLLTYHLLKRGDNSRFLLFLPQSHNLTREKNISSSRWPCGCCFSLPSHLCTSCCIFMWTTHRPIYNCVTSSDVKHLFVLYFAYVLCRPLTCHFRYVHEVLIKSFKQCVLFCSSNIWWSHEGSWELLS